MSDFQCTSEKLRSAALAKQVAFARCALKNCPVSGRPVTQRSLLNFLRRTGVGKQVRAYILDILEVANMLVQDGLLNSETAKEIIVLAEKPLPGQIESGQQCSKEIVHLEDCPDAVQRISRRFRIARFSPPSARRYSSAKFDKPPSEVLLWIRSQAYVEVKVSVDDVLRFLSQAGDLEISTESQKIHNYKNRFIPGDSVEVDWADHCMWVPAKVVAVHDDGSCDVVHPAREVTTKDVIGTGTSHKQWRLGERVVGNSFGKGQWFIAKIIKVNTDGTWNLSYEDPEAWTETVYSGVRLVNDQAPLQSMQAEPDAPAHEHGGVYHKGHHKHRHAWKKAPLEMQQHGRQDDKAHIGQLVEAFSAVKGKMLLGTVEDKNEAAYEICFEDCKTWREHNVAATAIRSDSFKMRQGALVEVPVGKRCGRADSVRILWWNGTLLEDKGWGLWSVCLEEARLAKVPEKRLLAASRDKKNVSFDTVLSPEEQAALEPRRLCPSNRMLQAQRLAQRGAVVQAQRLAQREGWLSGKQPDYVAFDASVKEVQDKIDKLQKEKEAFQAKITECWRGKGEFLTARAEIRAELDAVWSSIRELVEERKTLRDAFHEEKCQYKVFQDEQRRIRNERIEERTREQEARRRNPGSDEHASVPAGMGDVIASQACDGNPDINIADDLEPGERPTDTKKECLGTGSKHERLKHEGHDRQYYNTAKKQKEFEQDRARGARLREQKRSLHRDAKVIAARADSQNF